MAIHVVSSIGQDDEPRVSRRYAWLVFALSFGLLLSDYMSRQVLSAVFPLLKVDWGLTDARLGLLSGVVALTVGVLTFPLSVVADRFGRVRSLITMALLWSLATLGCAVANDYGQMLLARFCVGVGEAAYGSVGVAVVLSVFPRRMRAALSGSFMAGGAFGSVLGMALGGQNAAHFGWRAAFTAMALFGLTLAVAYWIWVTEERLSAKRGGLPGAPGLPAVPLRRLLPELFGSTSIVCAYVGSALQLFVMGAMIAWLASYMNRQYGLATAQAAGRAAVFVLIGGVGMIVCGALADRLALRDPGRKWVAAIGFSLVSCTCLVTAFRMAPSGAQLLMLALGMFVTGGTAGPAVAMVGNLAKTSIHATAFGTLTLVNSLLGLGPGPWLTGVLADRIGLAGAMQTVPLMSLLAASAFLLGWRHYPRDLHRLAAQADPVAQPA